MVASCKLRNCQPWCRDHRGGGGLEHRGGGEAADHGRQQGQPHGDEDDLVVMTVHLNSLTAKREVSDGGRTLKKFWDEVPQHIMKFRVRVLTGDFNMALWQVVPELRARGLQANLAAWYPWKHELEDHVRLDSCAIIMLGPCAGMRRLFDPRLLVEPGVQVGGTCGDPRWADVKESRRDEGPRGGGEVNRAPAEIAVFNFLAQGYPVKSYWPKDAPRRNKMIEWSYVPAITVEDSAVAEVLAKSNADRSMFPFPIDNTIGEESWRWRSLEQCKQKRVDVKLFDREGAMLRRGSHMPLLVFIGAPGDSNRTFQAQRRRAENADWRVKGKGKGKGKGEGSTGVGPQLQTSAEAGDSQHEEGGKSRGRGNRDHSWPQARWDGTRGSGGWAATWGDDGSRWGGTWGGGSASNYPH